MKDDSAKESEGKRMGVGRIGRAQAKERILGLGLVASAHPETKPCLDEGYE